MFKISIFLIVIHVTLSFGSNFQEKFNRLIIGKTNPEQQLYGASSFRNYEPITWTFDQKLDHFKPNDKTTWEQRAFVLNQYYETDGPFFIYLFGNEIASGDWLQNSRIMSYAKEFNALVIGLEHRFYGKSRPFEKIPVEKLNYLSIQQALADVAYFIESVNEVPQIPPNTKWITFGGFYGGSLAAWARMKYPHLVHGAVASSAPMSFKSEFPEYLESVKNAYFSFDPICARNIELATQQLNDLFRTEEGRAEITKLFKLCSSLKDNEDDFAVVRNIMSELFASFLERQSYSNFLSMRGVCNNMNSSSTKIENVAHINKLFLSASNLRCWYGEKDILISRIKTDDYKLSDLTKRINFYLTCTQIGLHTSSAKSAEMFGKPEKDIHNLCSEAFGSEFSQETIDDGVKQTNREFGGSKFNANRVIFVQNSMDPWQSVGITEEIEDAQYELVFINGTSHRADLEPSYRNSDDLINGISQIKDLLQSWFE